LSIRSIIDKGHLASFGAEGGIINIHGHGMSLIHLRPRGKLYILECKPQRERDTAQTASYGKSASMDIWHLRLGHVNKEMINRLTLVVDGLEIHKSNEHNRDKCEVCIISKMAKRPFKPSTRRASRPLELVHSDIAGPMRTKTALDEHVYVINFIDDYSRFKCTP
jgi:hypothetical protein